MQLLITKLFERLLRVAELWLDPKAVRARYQIALDRRVKQAIDVAEHTYAFTLPSLLRFIKDKMKLANSGDLKEWRRLVGELEREKRRFFRFNQ